MSVRLLSLSLEHFRSYPSLDIRLDAARDVHVFYGPNAAGKTNVLEAIGVLAYTKSFQGSDDAHLIRWGSDFCRIRGIAHLGDDEDVTLECALQSTPRRRKACFRNDVSVPVSTMVGSLPIVQFLPQDLDLFRGAPQVRRAFLDRLLCQVSPEYFRSLLQFQKLLKQRNTLLRRVNADEAQPEELAVWDAQYAAQAARVTHARLGLMEELQEDLVDALASLGEQMPDATLAYRRHGIAQGLDALSEETVHLLQERRQRDILLQATSIGPHREDWQLSASERPFPSFASRGQNRAALLSLIFLQVSFLDRHKGGNPVVLLDDVFSELDDAHQSALLAHLSGMQVLLTSTHVPAQLHGAQVWRVDQGNVRQE